MANFVVTEEGATVVLGDNDAVFIDIPGGGSVVVEADPTETVDKIRVWFGDDSETDTAIIDLTTFSENDLQIDIFQYDPTDVILLPGLVSNFVDPSSVERFQFTYIGSDGGTYTGYINAKDGNERDFSDPFQPITIICFGDGTLIETPDGPVAVEDLSPGDMVCTLHNGPQPLRWVGRRFLDAGDLQRDPWLRPILVPMGSFGPASPDRDLVLSPNHRIAMQHPLAEILFAEELVLVAAKFLLDAAARPFPTGSGGIGYNHLMLHQHEIVLANGLPCESLYPGPVALQALDQDAIDEIHALFPEALGPETDAEPAALVLRKHEAQLLLREVWGSKRGERAA